MIIADSEAAAAALTKVTEYALAAMCHTALCVCVG